MISVSDDFKKAIKENDRRIYGYVDVKYQNKSFDKVETQIPTRLDILSNNWLSVNKKIVQKYATLENNYTLLDGSFMVWNENSLVENGYATQDIFENINDNTIIITNNSTTTSSKGVSIYFKENLPFNFNVTINFRDGNSIIDEVRNNQTYNYQYIFTDEKVINNVEIQILNVEFPKNRLRIASVDFNMGDVYEGEELLSFDVTEELDLMIENLPINTCTINLNNYPNSHGESKFDVINPNSIVNYLDNNTMIEPYIGVLTENNGVEYVPMGIFYLSNWDSNPEGNVTMNGKSVLSKIEAMTIPAKGGFFAITTPDDLSDYLTNNTPYNFSILNGYYAFNNNELIISNLMEYIKLLLVFNNIIVWDENDYVIRKFYVDRYNTIGTKNINENSVDKISQKELLQDVNYNTRSTIHQLNITYKSVSQMGATQTETIINDTHTLLNAEEYIWYKVSDNKRIWDNNPVFNYSVVSGSASASLVDKNYYFMVVKVTGTIGSTIQITYTNRTQNEDKVIKKSVTQISPTGDNLDIDISSFGYAYPEYLSLIQKYYMKMDKPYKVTSSTIGDPSLEIGDVVSIQTRYKNVNDGYRDFIVTKQHFKFDGGLTCELEGVGD